MGDLLSPQDPKPPNPDDVTCSVRQQYLDQQPQQEFLGPRGTLRYHGVPGHRMCGYYWPAENAKGVVILVHGQGSFLTFDYLKSRVRVVWWFGNSSAHSSGSLCVCVCTQGVGKRKTYEGSWVHALNQAGYSCAGIDNRGCGRSEGLFGYVNDYQDWVGDLVS